MKRSKSHLEKIFILVMACSFLSSNVVLASERTMELFPIGKYDQNVDNWINPKASDYKKPLLDLNFQKQKTEEFFQRYFASDENAKSPWSREHVLTLLTKEQKLKELHQQLLAKFGNTGKASKDIGYGENFRPHLKSWIEKISKNVNLSQFNSKVYHDENRGILVQNTLARVLPTTDPHFYSAGLAGAGYPFDNLQMSLLWVGTPVYIAGETLDKQWALVITPDVTAWIPRETIAKVNKNFMDHWQKAAKYKLAAITTSETTVFDANNDNYEFKAYVGSIFPLIARQHSRSLILFPVKGVDNFAKISRAVVENENITAMPLLATPENFSKLIKTLQGRPYGWGGYNFYNDCSLELKSLYTPFGIWLPRNSAYQTTAGKMVDKSAANASDRINYLEKHGKPFLTIVYNTKHIFMYLGNYSNPNKPNSKAVALTYQNMWGLKPAHKNHRSVIGQSVLFPLVLKFPEDASLESQASKKDFKIVYLDQLP